ncbi:MAG: hypothetical protein WD342_01045 [Verrucomicrobiales bacterium]
MKTLFRILPLIYLASLSEGIAENPSSVHSHEEETFEHHVGEVNYLTGEGASIGGFLFPELFVIATGGIFEPGSHAEDFASSEHDPLNEATIQGIDLDLILNFNDVVTGAITGFAHQGEDHEWEAALEEAYLHYHLGDHLSVGGGQFLNTFGFQADLHLHSWDFVNQNLVNGRMLNEGELVTQGGEIIFRTPRNGVLNFAFGGVRTHAHNHGHGDEEEEHHEEEEGHEEEHDDEHDHHFEVDQAGFDNHVASADYKFRLPFDESVTLSTSLAAGENGFGRDTYVYGAGIQKIWNAHDHGYGPEFWPGATMLRCEFMGREVEGLDEDGEALDFDDFGFSTSLFYGLTDRATVSLRHDWISEVEVAGLAERHRISPALTAYLGPEQRVRARVQYDYVHSDGIEGEHAAWLQFQLQWGGEGGSHRH